MSLWSWIQDCVNWLVDKILKPVVNWIVEAIEKITAELRYWKHEAMKKLAEWLDND